MRQIMPIRAARKWLQRAKSGGLMLRLEKLDWGQTMLDSFSIPVEMLWLAVAFVAIMAGMLAAAPE